MEAVELTGGDGVVSGEGLLAELGQDIIFTIVDVDVAVVVSITALSKGHGCIII